MIITPSVCISIVAPGAAQRIGEITDPTGRFEAEL